MDHPNSVSLSARKNCFNPSLQLWWISLRKPSLQRRPPIRHHSLHWPLTMILVDKTKAHICSELRFSQGKSRLHVLWLRWLLFSPEVSAWKLLQLFWAPITRKTFFWFYVGPLVIPSKQVAQIPSLAVPRNKRCNGPFYTKEPAFQCVFSTHPVCILPYWDLQTRWLLPISLFFSVCLLSPLRSVYTVLVHFLMLW